MHILEINFVKGFIKKFFLNKLNKLYINFIICFVDREVSLLKERMIHVRM